MMRRLSVFTAAIFIAVGSGGVWAEEPDASQAAKAKDPALGESWSSDRAPVGDVPAADVAGTADTNSSPSSIDATNAPSAPSTVATAETNAPTIHHIAPGASTGSTNAEPEVPTETGTITPATDPVTQASPDNAATESEPAETEAPKVENDPGIDLDPMPAIEKNEVKPAPELPHVAAPIVPSDPPFLLGEDVREIVGRTRVNDEVKPDLRAVSAFYAARRGEVAWTTPKGLTPQALALIEDLQKGDDYGLDTGRYTLPSERVISKTKNGDEISRADLAEAEFRVSLASLIYARHARGGRIPEPVKQLTSYLDRTPKLKEPSILLEDLAGAKDPSAYLRGLHPQHQQFEKLRQRYIELRTQSAEALSLVRIPKGKRVKPGEKHPHIALLRERLSIPSVSTLDAETYDNNLVEAIKALQIEKGDTPDGMFDQETRNFLNNVEVPNPERILANMEQWRWMPENLGETYVHVNIPDFMFQVIHNGEVIHEERIVTGEIDKQTPVFSDILETVIFHPRWNVPESIKVKELYPGLLRGGGYFQRQRFVLMKNGRKINPGSVNWGSADIRQYDIYQPSGPGNVLGEVKFIFPNKHGVYMHDTTSKALFNETSRPFSHGCMRVRDPRKFAEVLMMLDKGWDRGQVDAILDSDSEDEVPVPLETKVPVHVTYFTTVIGNDGKERSMKDVYGHEQKIKLALRGRFDQIAVGEDHLAPVKFERVRYASPDDDWNSFFGGSNKQKKYKPTYGGFFDFAQAEQSEAGKPGKNGKPGKPGKPTKQAKSGGGDFLKNLLNNF